ncbi:PP2C family protein-serine/threonine phosphatase [Cephaloticoccus capnophilus]|uniref:PP2C family protein-serine/threonine phosphatase n=1 Tax=Cephaloticoccus capnophilus TaxID=1548208 RepID=UPI0009EE8EC1|nr:PP2C family serine/threonine-protein phosphatase [Cephaloticoccus capnophilus]
MTPSETNADEAAKEKPTAIKGAATTSPCDRLRWSALTHRGKVRTNNEDAFIGLCFDGHELHYLGKTGEAPTDTLDFVFAVSDGMGGAQAGEFASRIAIDKLSHWLPRSFKLAASGVALDRTEVLVEVFHAIHAELIQLGRSYEECRDMGATLSLCWVTPHKVFFCHIGDSRIYHLPLRGPLRQLSHDHTHPGWLRRAGKINEREARQHPMRHMLNQVLGAGRQHIEPQAGAVVTEPGDRFLICSDGLTDGLWDHHLDEFARGPIGGENKPVAEHLIAEALDRSGRDNLTAIVIETPDCDH